jgi:conserved domain protein
MILDGENLFFDKQALSAAELVSNVIAVGAGESGEEMRLIVAVKDADAKSAKTVLETSKTADFASAKAIGTYEQIPLETRVPRGNLGFLRIKVASNYTKGTITAGLVLDDNINI